MYTNIYNTDIKLRLQGYTPPMSEECLSLAKMAHVEPLAMGCHETDLIFVMVKVGIITPSVTLHNHVSSFSFMFLKVFMILDIFLVYQKGETLANRQSDIFGIIFQHFLDFVKFRGFRGPPTYLFQICFYHKSCYIHSYLFSENGM